ncbi:DUF547 domain-containing protein [Winogradskyella maritima]|uniref:DUF547 domain-containing protein n=1 Tax=Winogradskyella maritima TaxID=1517766 RepID=A0ABV8AJT7_9FLAO|nr:DUF547 domain-containing protein [Winogradskyella maritima]
MKFLYAIIGLLLITSCVSSKGLDYKEGSDNVYENDVKNVLDHSDWDTLLKKHVNASGLVDYQGFIDDTSKLQTYIDYLGQNTPTNSWSYQEQLAYYINVYNANTIKLIVDNYPVKSIKDVDATISPFLKSFINLGGKELSLADVEKGILQKMNEPRIHFAINCASISCPKLMRDAYTAENVDALMEQAGKEFVNSKENEISSNTVRLSEIFKWYKNDFLTDANSILEYVNRYSDAKINPNATVEYIEYNWNLNDTK